MDLETFWFFLIVVVWAMYFLLEGFDFGVGMLLPFVPRSDEERSTTLRTIGPVWDANEVWLVVAGGATFAAFGALYVMLAIVDFVLMRRYARLDPPDVGGEEEGGVPVLGY